MREVRPDIWAGMFLAMAAAGFTGAVALALIWPSS